ncbi:hypothetical protein M422DRAFT_204963 [Sphaerobolus stellatus SS14]|nr:hypothetical protein M422DRAFT_204963 [Sphaerobolus stellatus SS14]
MSTQGLYQLLDWTIISIKPGVPLSDDSLQALRSLLPDSLIVAALDLIDRAQVLKYNTPWGRHFYKVTGSTQNYSVNVDLPCPVPVYCSCPAFSYNVLISDNQAMCKHVLAVQLARRLGRCSERSVTHDELLCVVCPEVFDVQEEEQSVLNIS